MQNDPDSETARKWLELAQREQVNSERFDRFGAAIDAKEIPDIVRQFSSIGVDSIYHDRARPRYEAQYDEHIAEKEAAARQLSEAGKCDEVANLREAAETLWSRDASGLAAVEAACEPPARASTRRRRARGSRRESAEPQSSSRGGKSYDDLVAEMGAYRGYTG